jgi:hypothetical protein
LEGWAAPLGVETVPTRFELAYNSDTSEQIPTDRVVAIRDKWLLGQIGYEEVCPSFERAVRIDRKRSKTRFSLSLRRSRRSLSEISKAVRANHDGGHSRHQPCNAHASSASYF